MCNSQYSRRRGFTLIELLVVIIILSTFILSAGVVYSNFSNLYMQTHEKLSVDILKGSVRDLLKEQLYNSIPSSLALLDNGVRHCLLFTPKSLSGVLVVPDESPLIMFSPSVPVLGSYLVDTNGNTGLFVVNATAVMDGYELDFNAPYLGVGGDVFYYLPSTQRAICYDSNTESLYFLTSANGSDALSASLSRDQLIATNVNDAQWQLINSTDSATVIFNGVLSGQPVAIQEHKAYSL